MKVPLSQEELTQRELAQEELAQEELDWVLVCAPFRKDADYVSALLREHLIEVRAVMEAKGFAQLLDASPGIVIVSHEALTPQIVALTAAHLERQPNWSEVPIIVLLERGAPLTRIRSQLLSAWPGARLLFYTRPVAPLELVSGIQSNLLVRLRQRQVRDSIERERELRAELNHRVKNILATVTSIFRMTRRGAESLDDLATDFNGRLLALSNVHTAVFEAGGEDVSLLAVVDLIVSPYGTERIAVDGSDLLVSREAGTTLALCLHELITNAIKYGACRSRKGAFPFVGRWMVVGNRSSSSIGRRAMGRLSVYRLGKAMGLAMLPPPSHRCLQRRPISSLPRMVWFAALPDPLRGSRLRYFLANVGSS